MLPQYVTALTGGQRQHEQYTGLLRGQVGVAGIGNGPALTGVELHSVSAAGSGNMDAGKVRPGRAVCRPYWTKVVIVAGTLREVAHDGIIH
jgi:hypothetical protein